MTWLLKLLKPVPPGFIPYHALRDTKDIKPVCLYPIHSFLRREVAPSDPGQNKYGPVQ